jgi:hypothetical protein
MQQNPEAWILQLRDCTAKPRYNDLGYNDILTWYRYFIGPKAFYIRNNDIPFITIIVRFDGPILYFISDIVIFMLIYTA